MNVEGNNNNGDSPTSRNQEGVLVLDEAQVRARLIISWVMLSALWLTGFSIYLGFITPPPGFAVVAPWAAGVPAVMLLVLLIILVWRRLKAA